MSRKRRQEAAEDEIVSGANSVKRQRKYTDEDAKLVSIYENLADEAEETRKKAAKDLLLTLSPSQNPSTDFIKKALTRLIRGLCSGRKAARPGFFIALTEALRLLFGPESEAIPGLGLSVDGIVDEVNAKTQADANVDGPERRNHLLGQITGYTAIVQSCVLFQPGVTIQSWLVVLDQLFRLAKEAPWLRQECGSIICQSLTTLASEQVDTAYVQEVIERLTSNDMFKTPEGLAIWLTSQSLFPAIDLPSDVWHQKDPLCIKERVTLAKVMRENAREKPAKVDDKTLSNKKTDTTGTPQPQMHFAWEVILSHLYRRADSKAEALDFSKFWTEVVDNNLFSASASNERKSWGFQVFSRVIAAGPPEILPLIFSPNLMRCLINQRKDPKGYLHTAAKAPLNQMITRAKGTPELATVFVKALLTDHGSINFDQVTRSKTVETALSMASPTALTEIITFLGRLIFRCDLIEQPAEIRRRTLADMLVSLVRSRVAERDSASLDMWLLPLLKLFVKVTYFVPSSAEDTEDTAVPPVSDASRAMFQSRLSSCLTYLLISKLDENMSYPYFIVQQIHKQSKKSALQLVFQAEKAVRKTIKQAHTTLNEIVAKEKQYRSKNQAKVSMLRAFKLLFSLTILQVYNQDPEAVSILDELETCYTATFASQTTEATTFDLLLEVLLGFAAKSSALFRKLVEQVFTAFAADLSAQSLESLIEVLDQRENLAGQQALFEQEADQAEDLDAEDVEDTSDVKIVNETLQKASNEDGDADTNVPSSDDSSGDDDDEDAENDSTDDGDQRDEELDMKLAELLKTAANGAGSDSSDGDADMDDEEMMALEPHLTKIFEERKKLPNKKKEGRDAKETVINFKNRVLDLLAIYVKQQHANPLALHLILPLLRLVRTSTSKQLADKSAGLLKQYFDACAKHKRLPALDAADNSAWELLASAHEEALKGTSKLHALACSRSHLFLTKVLTALDEENFERAEDVYDRSFQTWRSDAKARVHESFFTEWLSRIAARKSR
ncbi:hypothetical protein B0A49_01114 [Cryomyces minteri]|uniref:DNA polymerase V n=1 Tax=Cryomyces minteri TaxID=331657 RepID=A0A4U0XVM1_9PEZI|nr:hypothetical protein B0A49_01114 [Cryomyces minteri]